MKLEHLSIFMPRNTPFYRRIFSYLTDAFSKCGIKVSGGCDLLSDDQMHVWIRNHKPDAVFEMNRVKDEIPALHDFRIPHIAWIVDFQGRTQDDIKGSDITYFFDPGCDTNYCTGGLQDWLPPGTCLHTFQPLSSSTTTHESIDFSFIGHIPLPWTPEELMRRVSPESTFTFADLLKEYDNYLRSTRDQIKTHADLKRIINTLLSNAGTNPDRDFLNSCYYDLMERTKRMQNRSELLNFALNKSSSIAIYGSNNWNFWHEYKPFYKHFVDCPKELNLVHQHSRINLHDGVSFHFRAIDCLASGGLLFWYDNNEVDIEHFQKVTRGRGLHNHFDDQYHFFAFKHNSFEKVYSQAMTLHTKRTKAIHEVRSLINSDHTWHVRAGKIIRDLALI